MEQTILLIEDEKNIVELVRYNLEHQGFRLLAAMDGPRGFDLALREKPSLILLDLMIPGMDGIHLFRSLQQNPKTRHIPVIMLTAKSEEADIVFGLELGADDYVVKPFSPRQLAARIRSVLRRRLREESRKILRAGSLEMDLEKHFVTAAGRAVELTSKEFLLLRCLLEAGGRVLSREAILDAVWGQDGALEVETRVVDKHVGELRKKIGREGERIITVKGFGYRFEDAPARAGS